MSLYGWQVTDASTKLGVDKGTLRGALRSIIAGTSNATPAQRAQAEAEAKRIAAEAKGPRPPVAPTVTVAPPPPPPPAQPKQRAPTDIPDRLSYWLGELEARREDLRLARVAGARSMYRSLAASMDEAYRESLAAAEAARAEATERGIREQRDPAVLLDLVAQYAPVLATIAPDAATSARDALSAALAPRLPEPPTAEA